MTNEHTDGLLPCPFCSGKKLTEDAIGRIMCDQCGATAPYGYKNGWGWNSRPAAQPELAEDQGIDWKEAWHALNHDNLAHITAAEARGKNEGLREAAESVAVYHPDLNGNPAKVCDSEASKTILALIAALMDIEMITASGCGLDPEATIHVHLLAGIGRAMIDDAVTAHRNGGTE